MNNELRQLWSRRLDFACVFLGAMTPVGLVIGNIAFELVVALTVVVWFIRMAVARMSVWPFLVSHSLIVPWAVWMVVIIGSVVVNGAGNKGFGHDIAFLRYLLFGMALLETGRRLSASRFLIYGLAAGVVWAALNMVCVHLLGFDLIGKPLARYTEKLKEAARIAGMAAYGAPLFLAWGLLGKELDRRQKIAISAIGITAFVLLLLIHIRTDILASAAGMFVIIAYFVFKRASLLTGSIGAVVLMAVIVLFFLSGDRLDLTSFYDRIYYWKVSWALWLENPFWGVGVSSYQDAYQRMATSGQVSAYVAPTGQVFKQTAAYSAHSLVLMLLASTGLFGLFAFGWLFVQAFRLILSDLSAHRIGLLTWPVVVLVLGITGCNIYHSWYQALLAFFIVLIGSPIHNENEIRK